MTEKEKTEARIVYDKTKIDEIMQPANGEISRPHAAYPYMADLLEQMKLYEKYEDADMDTCCMIYGYLGDMFSFVPYLPSAAECFMSALACARESENRTVLGEIPDYVYKAAKFRNMIARDRYEAENACLLVGHDDSLVYDECTDLDAGGKMKKEDVRALVKAAAETAGKALIADPAEHTPEYAELIFDMHETILSAFDEEQKKSPSFCFAFWAAKRSYLKNYGITWSTPATLNPELKHRQTEEDNA